MISYFNKIQIIDANKNIKVEGGVNYVSKNLDDRREEDHQQTKG